MSVLSRLKMPRPGQLLALVALALILGLLVFAALPSGMENMRVAAYKAWLLTLFAALGLIIDLVVFCRSRPGDAITDHERIHRELRRAVIVAGSMLAGGLAL